MSPLMANQQAFLFDFCKLIVFANKQGFIITAGELLRPEEMQRIYMRTGRSKTMNSLHLRKLAGDLNLFKADSMGKARLVSTKRGLQPLGDYWESLHPLNRWGGNFKSFKDLGHFERNYK